MGLLGDIVSIFTGNSAAKAAKKRAKWEEELARTREATVGRLADQQITLANRADARSQQQFDRYTGTFVPLEDKFLSEIDKAVTPDAAAGLAAADVERQVGVQRGVIARNLARRGVSADSGAAVAGDYQLGLGAAAARAGASTAARRQAVQTRLGNLQAGAQLGRNLPSQALGFSNSASSGVANAGSQYAGLADAASNRALGARANEQAGYALMGQGVAGVEDSIGKLFAMGG